MRSVILILICLSALAVTACVKDPKLPDDADREQIDWDDLMGLPTEAPSPLRPSLSQNCPYPEYRNPVVAPLEIPAHIRDGYFVPLHYEYVIIQDGYWQIRDYAGFPVRPTIRGNAHCAIPKG